MGLQWKDGQSREVHVLHISQCNEKEYSVPEAIICKYTKIAAKSKGLGWKKLFMKED